MTGSERYEELASKWLDGTITAEEKAEFSTWYHAHGTDGLELPASFAGNEAELRDRIMAAITEKTMKTASNSRRKFGPRRLIAAASVLLVATIGLSVWRDVQRREPMPQSVQHDIAPGGNRATLTLADGRIIELSGGQDGIVIGDDITYVDGSRVLSEPTDMTYMLQLTTPKGGEYKVVLPDGSNVWLNSASSLKYPSKFEQDGRRVELDGEAYFDIAPRLTVSGNAKVPFVVKTRNQEVEVLGTQFNINAYKDEAEIRTTLVEGKVRIARHSDTQDNPKQTVLYPGEQAIFTDTTIRVHQVDISEFTAWKDGYFYFNDADIYTVMKQFTRWYDIEVRYEIKSHDDRFVGKIPRNVKLRTALDILASAGVNFELRDRLLVVLPSND